MIRRPPGPTPAVTLFPSTTLCRSARVGRSVPGGPRAGQDGWIGARTLIDSWPGESVGTGGIMTRRLAFMAAGIVALCSGSARATWSILIVNRSEEHTSELQ